MPNARLLLCGVIEGPAYHAAVGDLVAKLGLSDRVMLQALAFGVPVVASTIRPFSFAAEFPGVHLCDPDDTQVYADALVQALSGPHSHRPLKGLTLADTAARYLSVAREVTQSIANAAPA